MLLLQPGALDWAIMPYYAYSRRQVSSHCGGDYILSARSVFQFHRLDMNAVRRSAVSHGSHALLQRSAPSADAMLGGAQNGPAR